MIPAHHVALLRMAAAPKSSAFIQRALGILPVPLQRPHGSLPDLPVPLHRGQLSHSALRSELGWFGSLSIPMVPSFVLVRIETTGCGYDRQSSAAPVERTPTEIIEVAASAAGGDWSGSFAAGRG